VSQVNEQSAHRPGHAHWRSLEQLADTPEIRALVEQEFPGYDPAGIATTSRRGFLRFMAASMALAGVTLTGCRRWPKEKLAPFTSASTRVPGVPEQYATAMELGGVAHPLLATSVDGRPIKLEGNPTHPMSWVLKDRYGSADSFAQASVLQTYDPRRSQSVFNAGRTSSWDEFAKWAAGHFGQLQGGAGGQLAILCEATSSPSVLDMRTRLLKAFPQAKWYEYEPITHDAELEGARQAFGRPVRPILHLDKADVAVFLDADPLMTHPAHVRYAADWSERRRSADQGLMSRVYVAETTFTITGTAADVRIPLSPDRLEVVVRAIAARLGAATGGGEESLRDLEKRFLDAAVADLQKAKNKGLVYAGPAAPAALHALCHAINAKLGAVGTTITLVEDPAADRAPHMNAIADLAKATGGGAVKTLLILGGNPVYNAPVDADFANALKQVPVSIHLSEYFDETSNACTWHLPRAHYLEAWGDARAWDGTVSVVQPLIEPLFGGRSIIEVLAILTKDQVTAGEQVVRRTWGEQFIKGGDFEKQWRKTLEAGLLDNSAFKTAQVQPQAPGATPQAAPTGDGTFFVRFQMDYHAYDGRFANNGWLQETHDPLTKIVWDNAAWISPIDAKELGLKVGDVVRIETNGRSLEIAVFILPGQPAGVLTLPLGYGRTAAGPIGDKLGFNSYILRASSTPYVAAGAKVTSIGKHYTIATTHEHHILDEFAQKHAIEPRVGGKNDTGFIVHEATFAQYHKDHDAPHRKEHGHLSLQLFKQPDKFNHPHAWGMAVDLNSCIGCNACVTACQAENNIPIVGKDMVLMHREMNWIRIDRYFKGAPEDPQVEVVHQPMMCVHCENAPCEQVCPVAATVHDTEGLNTMVYNRCIGTRYCSNNCPYKVRRFNYFDWHSKDPRTGLDKPFLGLPDQQQRVEVDRIRRMVYNPEVTVRMRGVMEKCTYCTQRIQNTKIDKRNAGEQIKDGDVITACAQACPTQAIVFGDLNDQNSRVVQLQKNNPRAYDVLGELNTRPRTRYLAKIRNPAEGKAEG
jgi:molybdopterin-containing oxidoreductase family iron-sulfur binding subunit